MANKQNKENLTNLKLKEEIKELLIQDRYKLIMRQPFIGRLATFLNLVPILDSRIDIACTDGTNIFVNAQYYSTLSEEERLGIIAHEVWHCALRHFARKGNRDRKKFNYATDIEVDLLLTSSGFKIDILPYDPDWAGRSAEEIYELMYPKIEQFQKQDTHLYPEDIAIIKELSTQNNDNDNENDDDFEQEKSDKDNSNNRNSQDYDDFDDFDDDDNDSDENLDKNIDNSSISNKNNQKKSGNKNSQSDNNQSKEQYDRDFDFNFADNWEEDWEENLQSVLDLGILPFDKNGIPGFLPGNLSNLITKKSNSTAADWKKILLNYVTNTFGGPRRYLPPNRRFAWKKLYLPSRERKQEINIILALDTSGSMVEEVPKFLTELEAMTSAFGDYQITIIQCDCVIKDVKTYDSNNPIISENIKFHGLGGTNLCPPFKYVEENLKEKPTVFIYITDGEGPAPKYQPDYPVIWAITPGGVMPCKWGIEVKINENDEQQHHF